MAANRINAVGFVIWKLPQFACFANHCPGISCNALFRIKEIFLMFEVHIETNWYLADF